MTSDPVISDLVASARAAQHGYEKFDQSQVDDVVAAIARTVIEPARNRHLSQRAVQDTGLGNVDLFPKCLATVFASPGPHP